MKNWMHLTRVVLAFLVSGCAGVGIIASDDPIRKLDDANHLFRSQDRPIPSERLIREAIILCNERNDFQCLGYAYVSYADLLLSGAIVKWQKQYKDVGFQDKSITFDNRLNKAREFQAKALVEYEKSINPLTTTKKFDALTNTYYNMAILANNEFGDKVKGCEYLDRMLEAYNENLKLNPTAKPRGNVPAIYARAKSSVPCS